MLDSNNPFETFSLAAEYFLDNEKLRASYQALQRHFHPDNFANKTKQEKLLATKISANLVRDYKVLQNPVSRAVALVNLKEGEAGQQFSLEDYVSCDKSMLFEQMSLREKLAEASAEQLPELKAEFISLFSETEKRFAKQLSTGSLGDAKESVLRLRFYQKLLAELELKG